VKPKVNIIAVVDVIRALSQETLDNGNLSLVDDGSFDSSGQGTPELCTVVAPGQVVQWSALAVDVQTPVAIQSITFLGGDGGSPGPVNELADDENPDLNVWSGVVPPCLVRGVPYRYRLELKMHQGPHSVLHVDSPALISL
jgi:hypothetical protein